MMGDAKQKCNSLHSVSGSNLNANMNEIFHIIYMRCHLPPPPPFSFVEDGKICIKTTFCQIVFYKLNNSSLILFYTFIETLRVETEEKVYYKKSSLLYAQQTDGIQSVGGSFAIATFMGVIERVDFGMENILRSWSSEAG